MRSHENRSFIGIVGTNGKGTRLGRLTRQHSKSAMAVGFDPVSGDIQRMVDIPLDAIQALGGTALVTTHFADETLAFVNERPHAQTVPDGGFIAPIESIIRNRERIEASGAATIGIVPGDARVSADMLVGLCDHRARMGTAAALLATHHLAGHDVVPVDKHGVVTPVDSDADQIIAHLGVHVFDAEWLLSRMDEAGSSTGGHNVDVWEHIYRIDNPVTDVALYVPPDDRGWVDMGTPARLRETIYDVNRNQVDVRGNIVFPGAQLTAGSTKTVALPGSTGLSDFRGVIIPEGVRAAALDDVVVV